jgi:hypothetical protein
MEKSCSSTVSQCNVLEHRRHLSSFLAKSFSHGVDEQHSLIAVLMDSRITMLQCAADRRVIHEKLYYYLRYRNDVRYVFARIDWFEHKDRIVLSMLAAWKCLAQSRADEEPVDARHVKKRLVPCGICGSNIVKIGNRTNKLYLMPEKFTNRKYGSSLLEIVDSVELMTS